MHEKIINYIFDEALGNYAWNFLGNNDELKELRIILVFWSNFWA